ncbi:MAG TPA: hypothetical protein VHN36_20630 [Ilumatobacteraceae bacterium]|nr:hypothetical protein [Ilumatobacteraceae bacterium]
MTADNPFVGPRSFAYGERLHGRDREVAELGDTLLAQRMVLLYSPSGAGKSSLLEAALRPRLEQLQFRVLPTVRVGHESSPTFDSSSVRNRYMLSTLLSLEEGRAATTQLSPTELNDISLQEYLELWDERMDDEPDDPTELCLFFDQFEELFTLDPTDIKEKTEFMTEVGVALRDRRRWALFAMREDFIAQLDPYLSLVPKRLTSRYRLDLLGVDAARVAMRRPAAEQGVDFSLDAANHLIDDLRRVRVQRGGQVVEELGPYVEPVQLQVVCRQLWSSLSS